MVFKRRNRRNPLEWARDFLYPKGGFRRAAQYVTHRLSRLPDEPHRIARGVFAGVFVSFTPFFGFHFLAAAGLAWIMRGNILAALMGTFAGNPVTTPIIAITSVELGHRMLGIDVPLNALSVIAAFSNAGAELWDNLKAVFTAAPTHWRDLSAFFDTFYWPYFIGGLLPGLGISLLFYWATIPIVRAYQKMRSVKLRERAEKRRLERLAESAAQSATVSGDDVAPPAS